MSTTTIDPSACATSFPMLSPEISADLMDSLIAAAPRTGDTPIDDPLGRDATLISEVDALHPRDLEETILATQLLAAHHSAMACFRAVAHCDPASKDASRLRRDAIALQRSAGAVLRALHRSQARPVHQNEADLLPRPTVPTTPPPAPPRATTPRRRKPQDAADAATREPPVRSPDTPSANDGAPSADDAPAAIDSAAPSAEAPPPDLFARNAGLQRLRNRWATLPRWEDMTMEQRRETFGYNDSPPEAGPPSDSTRSSHRLTRRPHPHQRRRDTCQQP